MPSRLMSTAYQVRAVTLPSWVSIGLAAGVYSIANWKLVQSAWIAMHAGLHLEAAGIVFLMTASLLLLVFGIMQWPRAFLVPALALLMFSAVVNYTSMYLAHSDVSRGDIVWMLSESERISDFIVFFGRKSVLPLLGAGAMMAALWFCSSRIRPYLMARGGVRTLTRIRFGSSVLFLVLVGSYGFVSSVGPVESNIYAFSLYSASMVAPEERPVAIQPGLDRYRKVIVVVDESVRSDWFEKLVSPTLPPSAVDLGAALSTGNCSASSNFALRYGVRRSDLGVATDLRSNPTLWSYARKAGYATVLIDGQLKHPDGHQNFVSKAERFKIDEVLAADVGFETDMAILGILTKRLLTPDPELIYVVLRGSHFPYLANLPPQIASGFPSKRHGYPESVAYSSGRFLAGMSDARFEADDVLVLYTSDHGQYFGPGSTHCRGDFMLDEWLVPMVVLGGGRLMRQVRDSAACWRDRAGHQTLRSTALQAMGYAWQELQADNFAPLTVCPEVQAVPYLRGKLPWVTAKGELLDLGLWPGVARRATSMPPLP